MNRMIVSNLVYRPLRSLISILAIAIEVSLILLIVGLSLGMLNDNNARQKGVGADVMVRPPGSSNFSAFSSAPVPLKLADILRRQPHVVAVAPVVLQVTSQTNIEVIDGIDLKSFEAVGGPMRYLSGGPFEGPYDMIVDDLFASANHVQVGSMLKLWDHDFRICGIIPQGRGARRYLPITTLQDLIGAENKASMFYVKLDDPRNADAVVQEFKAIPGMESYNIMSLGEFLSVMSPNNIPLLNTFIRSVVAIAMVIGFLVIFQAMYTAVLERTREIGILKSMGASKTYIVRVILRETLVLAISGIVVGLVISFVASSGIRHAIPTLPVHFSWAWVLRAAIIAIIGAMLGALYPAFKAAQKDPIDALAYE